MKTSKVLKKAANRLILNKKYTGCCTAIMTANKSPYYRCSFQSLYFEDAHKHHCKPKPYYFGSLYKENLQTRQLALLFAAEYYKDLGD